MAGLQLYITNQYNLIKNSIITVESITESNSSARIYPVQKQGSGSVYLVGNYTGDEDKEVKVVITSQVASAAGNVMVSEPTFVGTGSGNIEIIKAKNLISQNIKVTCIDAGIDTEEAKIVLGGLEYKANEDLFSGNEGNNISIEVFNTFSLTDSGFKTPTKLEIGENNLTSNEWNIPGIFTNVVDGTQIDEPADILGGTVHRILFESDPFNIYLCWRSEDASGKFTMKFSENIKNYIPINNKIYFVDGGRNIVITDENDPTPSNWTSQTLLNIRTLYDFNQAIIEYEDCYLTAITQDLNNVRIEGAYTIKEFNINTCQRYSSPILSPANNDWIGLKNHIVDEIGLTVNQYATYETIQIIKKDSGEYWDIFASNTEELNGLQVRTNESFVFYDNQAEIDIASGLNVDPYFAFYLPFLDNTEIPDQQGSGCEWRMEFKPYEGYGGETDGRFCFSAACGSQSHQQTIQFTFKEWIADCDCLPYDFDTECLDLGTNQSGGSGIMYYPEDIVDWTDDQKKMMEEMFIHTLGGPGETDEKPEQREVSFSSKLDKTFQVFKSLAQKIWKLNNDDDTELNIIADAYKALVNGIQLRIYQGLEGAGSYIDHVWNSSLMRWEPEIDWLESDPDSGLIGIDIQYSTSQYKYVSDKRRLYHQTHHQKKNSFVGTDCYSEQEGQDYWEVKSGNTLYANAYTGVPYYSHRKIMNLDGSYSYLPTFEFAVLIEPPCESFSYWHDGFQYGDKITLYILQGIGVASYPSRTKITINLFPNEKLYLKGGVSGNDRYIFSVKGSISSFANYILSRTAPVAYDNNGLGFLIEEGGNSFSQGDYFSFNVEGGKWQHNNSGSFGSNYEFDIKNYLDYIYDDNITPSPILGLQILFELGVYPSFVVNDVWNIVLEQSYKTSNIYDINSGDFFSGIGINIDYDGAGNPVLPSPTGAYGCINIDLGGNYDINCFLLDNHTFTGSITLIGSDTLINGCPRADIALDFVENFTPNEIECRMLDGNTYRYWAIRYTWSSENTRNIGFMFLGEYLQFLLGPEKCKPGDDYNTDKQESANDFEVFNYHKKYYSVNYNRFMKYDDYTNFLAMVDYLKTNNNEYMYFVNNYNRLEEVIKGRIKNNKFAPNMPLSKNSPNSYQLFRFNFEVKE